MSAFRFDTAILAEKERLLFTKTDNQTGKNYQLRDFTPFPDSFQEGFQPISDRGTSSRMNYSISLVRSLPLPRTKAGQKLHPHCPARLLRQPVPDCRHKLIHFKHMCATPHQITGLVNHSRLTQFHQLFRLLQGECMFPFIPAHTCRIRRSLNGQVPLFILNTYPYRPSSLTADIPLLDTFFP